MKNLFKATLIAGIAGFVGAQAATQYGAVSIDEIDGKVVAIIDGESSESVNIPEDVVVDSVVYNRKVADGYNDVNGGDQGAVAQTIVLPFTVPYGCTQGAMFYKMVDVRQDVTTRVWKAYAQVNTDPLEANTPYVMVATNWGDVPLGTVVLKNSWCWTGSLTLNTAEGAKTVSFDNDAGSWEFRGTYDYKKWEEGDEDLGCVFGFAAKKREDLNVSRGQFVKAKAGASIKPLRGYLYYVGKKNVAAKRSALSSSELASIDEVPSSVDIEFLDEEGKPMAIGRMNTATGAVTLQDSWFDLKGRRLNHKPTVKGTYYNNGKKVIIK